MGSKVVQRVEYARIAATVPEAGSDLFCGMENLKT